MQMRALFDVEDMAKQIYKVLTMNPTKKRILSEDAKRCVEDYFTWDRAAEIWMKCLDEVDISDNLSWSSTPPRYFEEIGERNPPEELQRDKEMLLDWCLENWYNHTYFTEYRKAELVQCLVTGADIIDQFNKRSFSYDTLKELFNAMINKNNMFENMRFNKHMAPYLSQEPDPGGMEVKII